jgi:hypothetical protein
MRFARWIIILIILALIFIPCASAKKVEWSSAGGNGNSYEAVLVSGGITWDKAKDEAADKGGHLATISSAAENNIVYGLVKDDKFWIPENWGSGTGPWIGLQRLGNSWQWITGEKLTYMNWAPGEPNPPSSKEDVAVLSGHTPSGRALKGPTWDDVWVDKKQNGYIIACVSH